MATEELVTAVTELMDQVEECLRQNIALKAIVTKLGVTDVRKAMDEVLAKDKVRKLLESQLLEYRVLRDDIDQKIRRSRGEVLNPPVKPN